MATAQQAPCPAPTGSVTPSPAITWRTYVIDFFHSKWFRFQLCSIVVAGLIAVVIAPTFIEVLRPVREKELEPVATEMVNTGQYRPLLPREGGDSGNVSDLLLLISAASQGRLHKC